MPDPIISSVEIDDVEYLLADAASRVQIQEIHNSIVTPQDIDDIIFGG